MATKAEKEAAGRARSRRLYTEWPSARDYTAMLQATVTKSWPFVDIDAVALVRDKLEWFHIFLSRFQDRQFRALVKRMTGNNLPPSADFLGLSGTDRVRVESWLQAMRAQWISENVSLIGSLTDRHRARMEQTVARLAGDPVALKEELERVWGMGKNRAELIAVDQSNKAVEALNSARYQQAGAITYRWITERDGRVRRSHQARDGEVFGFASALRPGYEIRCRCHAEPIFPRTLNPVETMEGRDVRAYQNTEE